MKEFRIPTGIPNSNWNSGIPGIPEFRIRTFVPAGTHPPFVKPEIGAVKHQEWIPPGIAWIAWCC